MTRRKTLPGLNIQWPWSQLILSGKKTVETRSYPLPEKYIGKELAIIETPGPRGKKEAGISKAQIIGIVVFSESFEYQSKSAWKLDSNKHLVNADDPQFAYSDFKPKWGWRVKTVTKLRHPVAPPKTRGIVFANGCKV